MVQPKITLGDLQVNRLGFGAMRVIGNDRVWGEPRKRENSLKVLRRAFVFGLVANRSAR